MGNPQHYQMVQQAQNRLFINYFSLFTGNFSELLYIYLPIHDFKNNYVFHLKFSIFFF